MKKFVVISALLAAGAFAPALAQDQGDPNPPVIPGPQKKPAMNEGAAKPAVVSQQTGDTASPAAAGGSSGAGDTSGPAAGTNVQPPTVVQKENPEAQKYASPAGVAGPSGTAAGSPGIEAKRGTQAGREWLPPEEIQRKRPSM
ncbi:hypothetical protein OGR47_14700 [Methylocystis sp. MJC1]|jgi:hypothetical protein|uniref:hypothetical protein n=1 Tax=Methylocystis sp. MJC1 TaxID=2654282 RepID=UPI0013EA5B1F|nr:hypothetical protein [Methylocystis sp. MJC1]KAF2990417.1 hypothetical protein MJC1_02516 [Methylocystis sp. MJC1]MBU6528212.1 hypothetical protein [Methylocystis sp. MJC1]UZX11121.1 hypothetical protein OGR47_14700 [Methylocystis sp. MJC1]